MIQELLSNGAALIFGVLAFLLGNGGEPREEASVAPPPMPALENWNPGVRPPTLEEVVYGLIRGAEGAVPNEEEPNAPTPVLPPIVFPSFPPVTTTAPVVIPPTEVDEPLPPVLEPSGDISTTNVLKGALVNIICSPAKGYNLRSTSGTGVLIGTKGVVVTVAHVGQYFLVTDYPEKNAGSCVIRTGSPAKNAYVAELIYISPSWIEENPTTIVTSSPKGTGEHDFSFLAITGSVSGGSAPSSFPGLQLAPSGGKVSEGDDVSVGSYGAEFLTSSQVRSSLYPTITFGSIKEAFTFSRTNNTTDIFAVNAGAAAQQGSSGGAVLNDDDQFLGLITTRTVKADLSLRDLQAITIDHLRRSFEADTGSNLDSFLRSNLSTLVTAFEDDAAALLDILDDSIE
ncbi:MAG: trypsin-like peptidase domain-containing protein [Patescibacteria group bacterium]